MAQNFSNVKDYKVVANNGFQFNVDVYGANNLGNKKWMLRAVEVISEYFTFTEGADEGLIVNVIVNTNRIIVKAEFNGKNYLAFPIQPRYGKNQIKDILDNMGVVKDVIDVYTNNMVNNNMEENNMVDMVNNVDLFNVYVKDMLLNGYNDACDSTIDACFDSENEYECGSMDYDYDIRKMWADWCWENDVMNHSDAYKYYDDNRDMFICEDDLDEVVDGFENTDDVGDGECLVWVRNPYYVDEDIVKNDSPYLDDVDRVVKVIKDYVINYEGMLMDYNGFSASMCVPWDVFNEDDMKMLIEDEMFEVYVSQYLMMTDIYDMLVYDDGVYVSVDAKKFNKVA